MRKTDDASRACGVFWFLWAVVLLVKVLVAARLPLFVDEAFYWQEGQHLAPAYSDLPGLTAWLTRLGVHFGGNHPLALRAPFLLLAALVPFVIIRITRREFGAMAGWLAGCVALLLPLAGTLGLLALPDAAMALATVLCINAGARLLREVSAGAALELALGMAMGALSHYRFIAVVAVGFLVLLFLQGGRRALRDTRVLTAIAIGVSAWAPLVAWNMNNADAGLRFQLVDRHPWAFHADGMWFVVIQALLVTPFLFVALLAAARDGVRSWYASERFLALFGALIVLGFFSLGFFADTERVSFHWPLPGYLALLPLLPTLLETWSRPLRWLTWSVAALGLVAVLGYYVAVSLPEVRARSAAEKWYPSNFAGWDELAKQVRERHAQMPAGTRIVADNFKLGAELGFALDDPEIAVLDHPINRKHGRAPQLFLWGHQTPGRAAWGDAPVLLVVGATEVEYKHLASRYHELCAMVGPLPPPQVLNIDHGRQRFLLFALEGPRTGQCTTPAMVWINKPAAGDRVGPVFDLHGWAFKDGVGLSGIDITIDGRVVAEATYGHEYDGLRKQWPQSNDPRHPHVGFDAHVDLSKADITPGRHWLGLQLHGLDGSVEAWPEQPIEISR